MIKKWTVLKEEDLSPSRWLPVRKYTVQLSNDQIIDDFFTVPFGNAVMVLPITTENEIVFVRQYKHGAGEILIELPAGFQQSGKTIEASALAELEEETGIRTSPENLISLGKISSNPTKTDHTTYGFLAKNLSFNSTQALDPTEEIEVLQIPSGEVLKMVSSGEIWVGDTVSFILKAYLQFPELFK